MTYNEIHSKLFKERLLDLMKDKMADPSNREAFVKQNSYAQAIVVTHTPTLKPAPKTSPKAKTETKKMKPKAAGKAKPKATAEEPPLKKKKQNRMAIGMAMATKKTKRRMKFGTRWLPILEFACDRK